MLFLLLLLGYLIGGIPFAVPVVRWLHGLDVRDTGSGNVGARNSLRVGGPGAAALVLLLDALKSAAPMLTARWLSNDPWAVPLVGVAAVLGHCYSPYLIARAWRLPWAGWRQAALRVGGQGLASSLGVVLVLAPLLAVPVLLLGAVFIFGLKRSTGAAVAMITAGPLAAWALHYPTPNVVSLGLVALIIFSKLLPDLLSLPTDHASQTVQSSEK